MVHALGNYAFLDETRLVKMVVLSGFVHFLAFFVFVFLPNISSGSKINIMPQYTPVLLVGPGELSGGGKSLVKPVTVPKARASFAAKKPVLIQKKVDKPIEISKTEPNKVPPLEKKEKTAGEDQSLNNAMNNIRENVENSAPGANNEGVSGIGVGTEIKGGGGGAPEMVVYLSIIIDRITEAWFLPPGLKQEAINRSLLTIIDIRIDREGKVTLQGLQQRSGNSSYDDFALKAIQKVQTTSFPPLPEVYREPSLDLGVRFHPLEATS